MHNYRKLYTHGYLNIKMAVQSGKTEKQTSLLSQIRIVAQHREFPQLFHSIARHRTVLCLFCCSRTKAAISCHAGSCVMIKLCGKVWHSRRCIYKTCPLHHQIQPWWAFSYVTKICSVHFYYFYLLTFIMASDLSLRSGYKVKQKGSIPGNEVGIAVACHLTK